VCSLGGDADGPACEEGGKLTTVDAGPSLAGQTKEQKMMQLQMTKFFLSLGAVAFLGLGATSATGDIGQASPPESGALVGQMSVATPAPGDAVENATTGSKGPTRIGEMDEAEKERRRQECDREMEWCDDWCNRTKGGRKCHDDCFKKYSNCLKKIPSNPVTDPDY